MIICPDCGTENRTGAKFCKGCAARLPMIKAVAQPLEVGESFTEPPMVDSIAVADTETNPQQALFGRQQMEGSEEQKLYDEFRITTAPQLQFETTASVSTSPDGELHISPLQAVLAAAALSNKGTIPGPRIAISVDTPREGWVVLPALETPVEAIQPSQADGATAAFTAEGKNDWSHIARATGEEGPVTWFIAGTPPNWQATPLAVVVLLEEDNERIAQWIGQELLISAMNP